MPAANALFTGSLNAVGSMIETAIPSALAEMAAFMASTISETALFCEPVHWDLHPTSAHASAMPYCVGVKNGLVVTWLTNTKFHCGWLGKFPSPEDEFVLPPHAASNDDKEKPAVPSAAPLSRLRRPSRNPDWVVELFDLFMRITSNSKTFVSSQGNR